ncbi:MAG TPA: signal peptidase II [Candidatus Acidoferrales bacterium]|jgi:signal peptidase II|nr:signal peptidase II [Candidatus Acidoferrales bacterium]
MRGARWLWISLVVLAADRATKFAIEGTSPLFRHSVVSDIIVLVHSQNPGIAFSMFSESKSSWLAPLLVAVSVAVMALLGWMIVKERVGGVVAQCGLALILGGAAGNALDRVMHGSVTDFLEVRLWTYIWPAFNVADSAITVGALLVLYELIFGGAQDRRVPSANNR